MYKMIFFPHLPRAAVAAATAAAGGQLQGRLLQPEEARLLPQGSQGRHPSALKSRRSRAMCTLGRVSCQTWSVMSVLVYPGLQARGLEMS